MATYAFIAANGNSKQIQSGQLTPRGSWNSATNYVPFDTVVSNNITFMALVNNLNVQPPATAEIIVPTTWTPLALVRADSNSGSAIFQAISLNALVIKNDAEDTSLLLPNLTAVATSFDIESSSFSRLETTRLATIGSGLTLSGLALTVVNFPVLTSVGQIITVVNNTVLRNVRFPSLVSVGQSIVINGNSSSLTTVDLPALTTITAFMGSTVNLNTNPGLTTFSVPSLINVPNGIVFDFGGCPLSATSLNALLARLVLSGATGGTVSTITTPTGQGLVDKATLTGRGWTMS